MTDQIVVFLVALAIAVLFFWYCTTDLSARRKIIGSVLTALLAAFCLAAIYPPDKNLKLGIDLAGGSEFVLKLQPNPGEEISLTAQEQAIRVLTERLNLYGTSDALIVPQDRDGVLVQMPGIEAAQRDEIRQILQKAAKLDFRMVHDDTQSLVAQGVTPPGYELKEVTEFDEEGEPISSDFILVSRKISFEGKHVTDARAVQGAVGWSVSLSYDNEGRGLFFELTKNNVGRLMAIMVDGEVVSYPRINAAINGNTEITGQFSRSEAEQLANSLENPLENGLRIARERSVSASLGQDTIEQGLTAGLIGLGATLLFVIIFYRLAGVIALAGLGVNIVILFGIMAMFQSSFTLPGIAGIILTIGMAIDANVLIFERLKEELKVGKSLGAAIRSAYDKAFSAIFDANITTLITAVILFFVGSGSIKGFAITLTVGIVASLFSSLIFTRVCFSWLLDAKLLTKLAVGGLWKQLGINFLGMNKLRLVVSSALIVLSVSTLVMKGDRALGIDFTGGDRLTFLAGEEVATVSEVKDTLRGVDLQREPAVQEQKTANERFITVRAAAGDKGAILAALAIAFPGIEDDMQEENVGPALGQQMMVESLIALGIGLVGILLYVSFRFEFAFAIGAIAALFHDLLIGIGLVALGFEINLIMVGAFLAIAGYSINDTIVVFDRIRETLLLKKGDVKEIMNIAINATLSRTLLTSGTTIITVAVLLFFGGPELRSFSAAILIGVLVGTYSSIFVASPVVAWWLKTRKHDLRREIIDAQEEVAQKLAEG
ncbi:MAG: protein translocase subunit SecD [Verrucomicrobiota bacterium]